jgi:hypothetical protein
VTLATTAASQAGRGHEVTFVYVSAHGPIPLLPGEYCASKRRAEKEIGEMASLRSVFLRPGKVREGGKGRRLKSVTGFMYSGEYPLTTTVGRLIGVGSFFSQTLGKAIGGPVGQWLYDLSGGSIPFETVASAALACYSNKSVTGVVSHNDLYTLSK